ncbi:hypothetical protein BC826DRAFT_982478 [Russula brevipes]|nr:hypothetical protein BC826DRAFT_982478 [Russula brevipes]
MVRKCVGRCIGWSLWLRLLGCFGGRVRRLSLVDEGSGCGRLGLVVALTDGQVAKGGLEHHGHAKGHGVSESIPRHRRHEVTKGQLFEGCGHNGIRSSTKQEEKEKEQRWAVSMKQTGEQSPLMICSERRRAAASDRASTSV